MAKPKNAVLRCIVGFTNPEWTPKRPTDMPGAISSVEFLAEGVTYQEAEDLAGSYNRGRLGKRFDGTWCVVCADIRGWKGCRKGRRK